jgi:selenocysteine lyase/cysteine desulfurase
MNSISSLIGNTAEFPILKDWVFFNHAAVTPLPHVSAEAFRTYATQVENAAYLNAGWHDNVEKLRQESAAFLHCHRDEIAFVKNTSEGLCTVAKGIEWHEEDRVVTTNVEYPANMYPWMDVARRHGVKLVTVAEEDGPDGTRQIPIEKIFEAASVPKTRLITLSHVEFASGQRHDLFAIGRFCRERQILFCVDGIQSLGAIPVDVKAMNIDFLSADGHKWLLGPEAAGIFYCRRELLDQVQPLTVGWMNFVNARNFLQYDFTLRPDAGRFESGSGNTPGLLALRESIRLISEAGIERISQRIKILTDLLIDGLTKKGYRIASPREGTQWSGIVSFSSPTQNQEDIHRSLHTDHRIEIALREKRLRCSPHFYNTEEQIEKLVDLLPKN